MSEEKLYAVKNDEGKYWDFYSSGFWKPDSIDCIATPINKQAELVIKYYGGHVVTLIKEPEKVVLTKKQSEIVDGAHDEEYPATCISDYTDEHDDKESLLMNAYVNGYTVKKESRYMVYVPGTNKKFLYNKRGDSSTRAAKLETPIVPSPVHHTKQHMASINHCIGSRMQKLLSLVCKTARKKR